MTQKPKFCLRRSSMLDTTGLETVRNPFLFSYYLFETRRQVFSPGSSQSYQDPARVTNVEADPGLSGTHAGESKGPRMVEDDG
jgi:hypothetical protein